MSYGPNRIVRIRSTPGSNFAAWKDELPAPPGVDGPGEFRCVKLKSRVLGVCCCNVEERRGREWTGGVSVGAWVSPRVLREEEAVGGGGGGGGASLLFLKKISFVFVHLQITFRSPRRSVDSART